MAQRTTRDDNEHMLATRLDEHITMPTAASTVVARQACDMSLLNGIDYDIALPDYKMGNNDSIPPRAGKQQRFFIDLYLMDKPVKPPMPAVGDGVSAWCTLWWRAIAHVVHAILQGGALGVRVSMCGLPHRRHHKAVRLITACTPVNPHWLRNL